MRKSGVLAGLAAAVAALAAVGCLKGTEPTTRTDLTKFKFDTSLHIRIDSMARTVNNVYYKDSVVGTGPTVGAQSTATVSYIGLLGATGQRFDSGTIQFQIGVGQVIPGWDDGISGMKVGGRRLLVIPPEMGYGSYGYPPRIPGNAVLVFSVLLKSSP